MSQSPLFCHFTFNFLGVDMPYTIGLDYGTNSVRCIIVDTANGKELAAAVWGYATGQAGIIWTSPTTMSPVRIRLTILKGLRLRFRKP